MTRRQLIDVGLVALLLVIGLSELLTNDEIDAPWYVVVVYVLVTTVPLVWRRRAPVVVLLVVLAGFTIGDEAYGIADAAGSPFAGLLLALYSAGAYADRRGARIAGAVLAAYLGLMLVTSETPIGDFFFIGGIMFGVFGAANVVRSRQQLAADLAARTVELEHEREETAKLAVAEERARIARELHDVVAHNVSVMVVQAGAERRALGDERPETAEVLETIEQTGRAALAEMRRLLGMLRRSDDELALAPQPTLDRVDDLVAQVRDAGMPVELRVEGERRPLPAGVDLSAYRIVQEALTNALKHAGPARARVTVRYGREELDIEIADDGAARAQTNGDAGGHGLVGMRERVLLFGGDLDAGHGRGGGYTVRARLPLGRSGT
jgi:signal transduction histidine kinase